MKRRVRTLNEVLESGGLMDVPETAQALRVSIPSIYAWAKAGKLPHIKLGVIGIRVDPNELQAWINAKRQALKPVVKLLVRKACRVVK